MAKSKEQRLFGVKHASLTDERGTLHASAWAELRAPGNWGTFVHNNARITWFADPGARDEFKAIFGGISVTIDRKDRILTGDEAMNIMQRASR